MPPDIVGRPAWELAKVLNDYLYFMGVSALPEDVSDAEFARNCAELLGTVDNSSQTPAEWQTLGASEGPPEAAPESPPVRLVLIRPGRHRPNPRASLKVTPCNS